MIHATLRRVRRLRPPEFSFRFVLGLLVLAVAANYQLQPKFFQLGVLSGNLRTHLPLMLLAAGQTLVILGGGIDLSAGAMVSLANVVAIRSLQAYPGQVALAVAAALGAGLAAGALNGLCVAYGRLQPIVTTFASSFVIGGVAQAILPTPGGSIPAGLDRWYRSNPLAIPLTLWVAAALLGLWGLARQTRYRRYLYAVGSDPMAAYVSGVPVARVRLSSYLLAGLLAACAGLALMLSTGTGDPLIGNPMTLGSIVAVVLGGTRLSGGAGGITGSLLGVVVLGLIRSMISFADVPLWWQTLADSLIILAALAGPGLAGALRRRQP